jgi:CRP-like cAMP-binding protein
MVRILESVTLHERFGGLPTVAFASGEIVLEAGTSTGRLYVLQAGSVEVVKDGTTIGLFAEPGTIFGELAALLDEPHTADVRALEPSTFRVADAAELLSRDPLATLYVATTLARRLNDANRALVELRHEAEAAAAPDSTRMRLDELRDAFFF